MGLPAIKYYCSLPLTLLLALLCAVQASAAPKVIGYVATFKDMATTIDSVDLTRLTHINLAFANPNASGVFINDNVTTCMRNADTDKNVTAEQIGYLVEKAHNAGVKVLISVAGGVIPQCSGDWATLLQKANRQNLINNLLKYVDDFHFDGIDIDIEGSILTSIDEAGNYTPFVKELSAKLKKRGKLLTCATASYNGGMIPVSSIRYFDFVNIMSYDTVGPGWGVPGAEHSTYEKAVADVNLWKKRGLSKEKLVLGVPFYGYGFGSYDQNYNIKDIIAKFGLSASDKDLIGKACVNCDYITYNGSPTIKAKTRLAMTEGSGVMIWEISQDASGDESMLKAINAEIKQSTTLTTSK